MRISDWSSDVCSSDLSHSPHAGQSFTGDDEMIDKADAEHGPKSRKIARRPQIFRTGRGITARMIMRNDHLRCIGGKSRGANLAPRPGIGRASWRARMARYGSLALVRGD